MSDQNERGVIATIRPTFSDLFNKVMNTFSGMDDQIPFDPEAIPHTGASLPEASNRAVTQKLSNDFH